MANHSSSFAWKIPWTETSGGLQTVVQRVKSLPAMWETQVQSLGQEDSPGEGNGSPLQYFCLENSHGQRRLAGYSPRCPKESDATEQFCVHIHMISYLTHLFF